MRSSRRASEENMVAWSAVDHHALPASLSREVVLVSHTDLQRVDARPAFNESYVTTATLYASFAYNQDTAQRLVLRW